MSEKPGSFPYTRGVSPEGYQKKLWTMRQYAGFADAEDSNKRYLQLLSQGTTGLSVAFDLPTQMGYDSDHVMSQGEVGRTGVAVCHIQDMDLLFKDIDQSVVSTSMTINSTASVLLALYLVAAEKKKQPWAKLRGTIQNDLLKEYIARGTYIYPPKPSLRIISDIMEFCAKEVPLWNTISVSGYHIREAGSTAAQELGFTLANGLAYVQAAVDRGLNVDMFAPRVSFFFNCHNDFLGEIAKFRAARRLWAKLMKERFQPKDEKSLLCRFHTQTGGSTLTAQQPENNVVRVAIQALAAVLGGTQSLHTNGKDEALSLPTEQSATLALRTQQIVAYESGVTKYVDPLGGSEAIESLTDQLEAEARTIIEDIDANGGVVACIDSGHIQAKISEASYDYQKKIDRGENIIVGVNKFQSKSPEIPLMKIDKKSIQRQVDRLEKFKQQRSSVEVNKALADLKKMAGLETNLMPSIVHAVRSSCTLGEIADVLRDVFGTFRGSSKV